MKKTIHIIGIPTNLGQKKAGVEMGCDAIRAAGLHQALRENTIDFIDEGNIFVPAKYTVPEEEPTHYRESIKTSSIVIADKGRAVINNGGFPLYLGGDHSMAIGTIAASSMDRRLGVVWIDAHGDFNTEETTPSNNIHGMPLAISCGLGNKILTQILDKTPKIRPEDIVIIGVRDLDPLEKQLLEKHKVTLFTPSDIEKEGLSAIIEKAKAKLKETDAIHLSFDIDSLNPTEAEGFGTPVLGGLTLREVQTLVKAFKKTGNVISMDVTEVNPLLDTKNKTATIAVNVIVTMFAEPL